MPLSPISLLVGGTLAAIGSAYVFKKFVYDPHLAPLIEALLAEHDPRFTDRPEAYYHNHHHDSRRHRQPVPIPVSVTTGSSSSRHLSRGCQPGAVLRRRSARRDSNDFERDRGLPKRGDGDIELDEHSDVAGQHRRSVDTLPVYREAEVDDAWGRHSAYELKESVMSNRPVRKHDDLSGAGPSTSAAGAGTARAVFDADAPDVGSSAHLRPPSFRPAGEAEDLLGPAGHSADPVEYTQASTAFSILSLSQISSPESPTAALVSMQQQPKSPYRRSPLAEPTGLEMSGILLPNTEDHIGPGARDDDERDDIISLADTDAGVHSLPSRATSPPTLPASPVRGFTPVSPMRSGAASPFSEVAASRLSDSLAISELGLSWAPATTAPAVSSAASQRAASGDLRRAPMSVVSLSESEGWSAGSEWDGLADEHHMI